MGARTMQARAVTHRGARVGAAILAATVAVGNVASAPHASAATATSAAASTASAGTACSLTVSMHEAGGTSQHARVTATQPPTLEYLAAGPAGYWAGRVPRLATSETYELNVPAYWNTTGFVVIGDSLYLSSYDTQQDQTTLVNTPVLTRIGGGWSTMRAIELSQYDRGDTSSTNRSNLYALDGQGVLLRWKSSTVGGSWTWVDKASFAGFGSVRSMTLISQTATYDTLLMNTRGGALYTVHVPVTSPMKPVVKLVRSAGWAFTQLLASPCGRYGTLVVGVASNAVPSLFAVGHATGTSTVIVGLGKPSGALGGSALHERVAPAWLTPPHNGE